MASSFAIQIPTIVYLISKIKPNKILDIGKGFGKYGFLAHEYVGIDNQKKLEPTKLMREQSQIQIDAVEADRDLLLPHLSHIYNNVFFGDILNLYSVLGIYDLVLMIDIIEHLDKAGAINLLKHLLKNGSKIIISTPIKFFEQNLYESEFENHISHWTIKDFQKMGFADVQYVDAGAVYLLSPRKENIVGFGNGLLKKIKRIARSIKNEFN